MSADPGVMLITHSLDSCIGIVIYDPVAKVAGMLHFQLPSSKGDEQRAEESPAMFGDKGIPLLFDSMLAHGAARERFILSMFGGASIVDDDDMVKIAIKNARTAKKILWQSCMSIRHEEVGGSDTRSVGIEVDTGQITLSKQGSTQSF